MAVNKKLKNIYNKIWEKPELFAANTILKVQEKSKMKKYLDPEFHLSEDEKYQIKEFWKPFYNISSDWCAYYYSQNGIFDPRYIPNDLYFTKIDQYFNSRKLGWGFNDKNYYSLIFPDVCQPKVLIRKIGSLLFDEKYRLINIQNALKIIESEYEIIIKPSQESGSGRGIAFYKTREAKNEIRNFLENNKEKDYIIQAIVQQHESLAAIYPNALNTIRVTTLLLDDGVHVLSSILRMGAGKSRVDNASNGGVSVGINSGGKLNKFGHVLYKGTAVEKHPNGFRFENFEVPEFDKIIYTVKRLAQYTGNFRLVSWDMTVDCFGNVILVESNMRKGGIAIHQFNNGPLFGDLTERVLSEVLRK